MTITISLNDDLIAGLEQKAQQQRLSVEQFALRVLMEAAEIAEYLKPSEVVRSIQATGPNPAQLRTATENLADLLRTAPGDPCFDLPSWNRQWSLVESELNAVTRANAAAERIEG